MSTIEQEIAGGLDLTEHQVATLRGLVLDSAYSPMDGMCLDELRIMALIHPHNEGYALTPAGENYLRGLTTGEKLEKTSQTAVVPASEQILPSFSLSPTEAILTNLGPPRAG